MVEKKVIEKKKTIIFTVVILIVIIGVLLFSQREVLIKTIQTNFNNFEELSVVDVNNWDLTKVDIVYDKTGIAVPVPKGYTASSVESEMYVNGVDEIRTGTETELEFSSTGDYAWTQNEDDGVWISGNKGVVSTTSTLTSNEFTIGEAGGRLTVNCAVSCYYPFAYLYAIITNTETGEQIRTSNIPDKFSVEIYEKLIYTNLEEDLTAGRYTVEINYYKDSNTSSSGLDSGYVKNASVVSYDDVGSSEIKLHNYGGFVIYEGTDAVTDINVVTAQKTRNQWVWVPVDAETVSRVYRQNDSTGVKTGKWYEYSVIGRTVYSIIREPTILEVGDREYDFLGNGLHGMTRDKFYQELQVEFEETIESIKKYGGFYIGRYETGNISSKVPVVQKMNTDIASQTWYAMYSKMQYVGANVNVKANMIWGCLWDETLQWFVDTGSLKQDELVLSTSWGNYLDSTLSYTTTSGTTATTKVGSGTKIPTGSSEYTKVNNIYDMAGNVHDWTLEDVSNCYRCLRGGDYYGTSSVRPASFRYYNVPSYSYRAYGFRAYLYIK